MHSHSDRQLILEMHVESELAFQEIFERYKDRVYGKCFFLLKDHEVASDISQDVFLAVWKHRQSIYRFFLEDESQNSLLTYLYRLSRNASVNYLNKQNRFQDLKESYLTTIDVTAEITYGNTDPRLLWLNESIASMAPRKPKQAAQLVFQKGYEPSEAAEIMGIDAMSIHKYLHRAKTFLKLKLNSQKRIL